MPLGKIFSGTEDRGITAIPKTFDVIVCRKGGEKQSKANQGKSKRNQNPEGNQEKKVKQQVPSSFRRDT